MKFFQPSILIEETVFATTKIEVNKPDLRRIYLRMVHDEQNAPTHIDVLGN